MNAVGIMLFEKSLKLVLNSFYFSKDFKVPRRLKYRGDTHKTMIFQKYIGINYGKRQRHDYVPTIFNSILTYLLTYRRRSRWTKKDKREVFFPTDLTEGRWTMKLSVNIFILVHWRLLLYLWWSLSLHIEIRLTAIYRWKGSTRAKPVLFLLIVLFFVLLL